MLAALAGLSLSQSAFAQTPADLHDLVGGRAGDGETALTWRGYVNVRTQAGDDRKWTYWWSQRRGVCLSVVTRDGRYDSITVAPAPDCRPKTPPPPVGGLLPGRPGERPIALPGLVGPPETNGRTEELRFAPRTSAATRRGAIKGYESTTYLLDLQAGQALAVSMQTSNRSAFFNVTAPRANQAALFNGSVSGDRYRGRAAVSGRYRIEVYLMRNAARRGESATYVLNVSAGR